MPMEEFVMWQAYLRRYPRGLAWDNWVQATLAQRIDSLLPRPNGSRMPAFDKFVWKPPEPLFIATEKARAKRRKKQ